MGDEFRRFVGRDGAPDGVAFEEVEGGGGGMFRKDFGVARVVRISRGVSVFDALFLAVEFERIPEQGDAEDAEGGFE